MDYGQSSSLMSQTNMFPMLILCGEDELRLITSVAELPMGDPIRILAIGVHGLTIQQAELIFRLGNTAARR